MYNGGCCIFFALQITSHLLVPIARGGLRGQNTGVEEHPRWGRAATVTLKMPGEVVLYSRACTQERLETQFYNLLLLSEEEVVGPKNRSSISLLTKRSRTREDGKKSQNFVRQSTPFVLLPVRAPVARSTILTLFLFVRW